MGYGDELLGSGMAKGLFAKQKLAAFGDGRKIIWSEQSYHVYAHNPNVAPPGSERLHNLVWIPHYRGHRMYASPVNGTWRWNYDFRAEAGEIYLTNAELLSVENIKGGFVLIEPSVKKVSPNKQWPVERYKWVATQLLEQGVRVCQFTGSGPAIAPGVELLHSTTFRHALAILRRAELYIGPEGGLHHGAAALGVKAVVIFGGFIHPKTTGYDDHVNLFSGGDACGTIGVPCNHCLSAMSSIQSSTVLYEAQKQLGLVK